MMTLILALIKTTLVVACQMACVTGHGVTGTRRDTQSGVTGAVAADSQACSNIGARILDQGGSAVDSAIATMLCSGVVNMHSSGVSGGGFMVVYKRDAKEAKMIDFREEAPKRASRDMFKDNPSAAVYGGKAIGVPGEISGFRTAWKKYGVLPWKKLVQPAIDLAKSGFQVTRTLLQGLQDYNQSYPDVIGLGMQEIISKATTEGNNITLPKFAETLESIRDNPDGFYTGSLGRKIAHEIQEFGGLVTIEDLEIYRAIERHVITGQIEDAKLSTVSPPAGGVAVEYILNILKGYNFSSSDRLTDKASILTHHRILEAFMFGFAGRSRLGDPDDKVFGERIKKAAQELSSPSTGDKTRMRIWDNQTHSVTYYDVDGFFTRKDHGTCHASVLASNGDAVAVTSSVNYWFGCGIRSNETGIIYNNIMADFDNPGNKPIAGLYPSSVNFPGPRKRPQSSMSPTVITDQTGKVLLVLGASGGRMIITSVAQVIMNKLWFNRTLPQSVNDPRVYTSLMPKNVVYTESIPGHTLSDTIRSGLKNLGHVIESLAKDDYAAVQAIWVDPLSRKIEAFSDPRKGEIAAYSAGRGTNFAIQLAAENVVFLVSVIICMVT